MSRLRLIACDIDGTLLSSSKTVTKQTLHTLRLLQEQGIPITLVTGRHLDGMTRFIKLLDIRVPVACSNGAVIYDPVQRAVTMAHVIPEDATTRMLQFLAASPFPVSVYAEKGILLQNHPAHPLNRTVRFNLHPRHLLLQYRLHRELNELKITKVPCLSKHADKHKISATNIHIETGRQELNEVRAALTSLAGSVCDVLPTSSSTLTIVPAKVNKASGLAEIVMNLDIAPEEIIAFGDDLNDLEMIRYVGHGVAMGNGHLDLKQIAKHVTDSNDQDGIVKALKHFQLF